MLLRMSTLFLRTLREDPADAEVPSHRLLVRGGYIRRAAPGGYTWLPLGWRVYRNVERIVREEMDAMGAQEVHFPALLPKEPYELTNRWTEYGDDIFRLKDRKGADFLLAPTHEEMFTLLVKDLYSSYKDLPLWIYQIQTKFRDETRPRAGLLRGREFVMKDSYSFDIDDAGLDASYDAHREAYIRIFDRLGLDYVIVAAMSGAMGGSRSEEFLTPAVNGEDTYVRCTNCDYAANTEAVRIPVPDALPYDDVPAAHVEDTPDTPTIETLVALANSRDDLRRGDRDWTAADTLKNVVVKLRHPGAKDEVVAIGVPGDREIDLKRLGRAGRACSCRAVHRGRLRRPSRPGAWLHRAGRARDRQAGWCALSARPARRRGHPLDHRCQRGRPARVRPRRRSRLHRRRHDRGRRGARGRHVPQLRPRDAGDGSRHRDGSHLPARPQVRRRARPQGAQRERQAGRRDHGVLRHRRLACRGRDRRDHARRHRAVLAARGRARRRTPRGHRQGRLGVRRRCRCWPTTLSRKGSPCSTTTGAASRPA